MNPSLRKFLLNTVCGIVAGFVFSCMMDLFSAPTELDTWRILSDGYFLSAAMFLVSGGLKFTKNGGVLDGLTYTFKTAFARVRRNFEHEKMSFADYRRERERKATSCKEILLAGAVLMVIAVIMMVFYYQAL